MERSEEPVNWSEVMGTSRIARRGPLIAIGGLASLDDDGTLIHPGDPYAQTQRVIERIEALLEGVGGGLASVVQTRIFVASGVDWRPVARAHGEAFGAVRPATTMLWAQLLDPAYLLEIDALGWVGDDSAPQG